MVKFTERDLTIVAGLAGAADFYTEGKFSAPVARALKKAFGRAAPVAARGAASFVPRALGTARFVAMRHPYIAAAVITYEVVKNREQIAQLAQEGWQIIQPAVEPVSQFLQEEIFTPEAAIRAREVGTIQQPTFIRKVTRRASSFNKAVSQGMRAIKTSTSYGGKGKIKPAKKAFSVVVKLASAKKKKKKAPKSGIRRRIWNAMKGLR
jgi:hypothetical protein